VSCLSLEDHPEADDRIGPEALNGSGRKVGYLEGTGSMDDLCGTTRFDRRQLVEEGLSHLADEFVVVTTRDHDDPMTGVTALGAFRKRLKHGLRKG
jgi:hypothetical protein